MRFSTLSCLAATLAVATPAATQEYYEYDYWEGETELNQPLRGQETEYENGDVEIESEAYEWESDQGYHEEEWYDPSDWFDADYGVDYETDYGYGYDYDAYDTYDYDSGYNYGYDDAYDYAYDYGYDYDYPDYEYADVDYTFDREVKGEVVSLRRLRGEDGAPQSVRLELRTEGGQTRTLHLGDLAWVDRYLPRIEKGERVIVGGRHVNINGRRMFKAEELRSPSGSYLIPDYEYQKRIEGELVGLRRVELRDGEVQALVARVEPYEGKTMDILLGSRDALGGEGQQIGSGSRVRVKGYAREVGGDSTFVVQDIRSIDDREQQDGPQRNRQARQQRGRNDASR